MSAVYCDLDLASGGDDGSNWTNAYQTLEAAASGASAGDIIYVKGTQQNTADTTVTFATDFDNPVIMLGCQSATTNEPPQTSDLIPGWRTGESRTEANLAYNDGDLPELDCTGSGIFLRINGTVNVYAFRFSAGQEVEAPQANNGRIIFEECEVAWSDDQASQQLKLAVNNNQSSEFINTKVSPASTGSSIRVGGKSNGRRLFRGGKLSTAGAITGLFKISSGDGGGADVIGMDLSDAAHTLISFDVAANAFYNFQQCKLHASTSLTTATPESEYRAEFVQCSSVTGKSSGTFTNLDIVDRAGNITDETTAVRTGGASDGSTSYSLAFTPNANETRDQYLGLIGPWMAFKVSGDGTSQTVTVYIANSGAADYNDDDVWLEVVYPSEGGTAQYDNQTTQMDLLGTPTAVTDDTDSTWGTGGNNPQKLEASIAPDYVGRAYCRVVFAKNFSSSPETLYVDPKPVVS